MAIITKRNENTILVDTGDVPQFKLKLENLYNGIHLTLDDFNIDNMQIYKDKYHQVIENPNGMLLYSIKTNDKVISDLKFVYDCGFKLDWEISEYVAEKPIMLYDLEKDCTELILGENRFTIVAQ